MKTIRVWIVILLAFSSCGKKSDEVKVIVDPLTNASQQTGVARNDLQAMALMESGGRCSCTGGGLLQVKSGARKQVNKLYHTDVDQQTINTDATTNALFGARYLNYITAQLKKKGYKNPTFTQRYLAYQQGTGGFYGLRKTLKSAPHTKITPYQYINLPGKIRGTSYSKSTITQQQYYNYWNRRVRNVQAQVAACNRNG